MSANKNFPHILILPEDDANRQLANGFYLEAEFRLPRQLQILPPSGGWRKVLDNFVSNHIGDMERYSDRYVVLLIDFDNDESRLERAQEVIPNHLSDRVFVIGVWTEPEKLKASFGTLEGIGASMAKDCRDKTEVAWKHELLSHNAQELERLCTLLPRLDII